MPKNFDVRNKIPDWKNTPYNQNINAQALLKIFGGKNVSVADISSYESPDFILDLNDLIVDPNLLNRFDVIVDVGTLEHIFDINVALSNIVRMLKVGGRLILVVPASNAIDHGFYSFSPTLFFDYFSDNGFSNFSCYLREGSSIVYEKKSKLYEYLNVGNELPIISKSSIEVSFSAIKFEAVDVLKKPLQTTYKLKSGWGIDPSKESNLISNPNQDKGIIFLFLQKLKFYGGKFFPSFLEIIRLMYMRLKSRNIKYIGKF